MIVVLHDSSPQIESPNMNIVKDSLGDVVVTIPLLVACRAMVTFRVLENSGDREWSLVPEALSQRDSANTLTRTHVNFVAQVVPPRGFVDLLELCDWT
jgi:hypothetical protein